MAGGAGAALREVIAFFGLDLDKAAFRDADNQISALKDTLVSLGKFLVTGWLANEIRKIGTETAEAAVQVERSARKIGISAEALQELRIAAEDAEIGAGTMDGALARLARTASEAASGNKEARRTFAELGVGVTGANGQLRPTDELLGAVADRLASTRNQGDRLRLSFELFGREGNEVVTMLENGSAGLEQMRAAVRETGAVMDRDLIATAMEYDDAMDKLRGTIQGVKNVIAKGILPVFRDSVNVMRQWIKENGKAFSGAIVTGVRSVANVMEALWNVVRGVGGALQWASGFIPPLVRGFMGLGAVIGAVAWKFSPLMAALFALFLLIDDYMGYRKGKDSLIGRFKSLWDAFLENPINPDDVWYVQVFQAIAKAIHAAIQAAEAFYKSIPFEEFGRYLQGMPRQGEVASAVKLKPGEQFVEIPREQLWGGGIKGLLHDLLGDEMKRYQTAPGTFPLSPPMSINVNQTINTSTGASAEQIGKEVSKQTAEQIGRELRGAVNYLVPATSPTGGQ